MHFFTSKSNLLPALQHLVSIIEKRQTWTLLNNVLIEAIENQLQLTSTDMEIEVKATIAATVEEVGTTTLPARKWLDICRNLPDDSDIDVTIKGSRATIYSGKTRFNLATMPSDEFPQVEVVEDAETISFEQKDLKDLIERSYFAMAQQDVRYFLNGLYLELNGNRTRAVATDGHRLALAETANSIKVGKPHQVILPRKGVFELIRLLQDSSNIAELQLSKNHFKLKFDDMCMTSKLIEGDYPDYNKVFPAKVEKEIIVERETLRSAISRVLILSNEKSKGIRLDIENNVLQISSHNLEKDQEEAFDEIDIEYEGQSFEIGFNGSYVLDALGAITNEKIKLSVGENNSCGIIMGVDDETARYVIMPLKL